MNELLLQRISELREEKDISQRQLQRDLGLSPSTITKWKTSTPNPSTLQKVADYFNVSTDYLTGRTKYRNKDHMLQSFDQNLDLKNLLDGNTEVPYDKCIQTEEGIILIESKSAAPKYITPETRELAEHIEENQKLKEMMQYLERLDTDKFDSVYNIVKAFQK